MAKTKTRGRPVDERREVRSLVRVDGAAREESLRRIERVVGTTRLMEILLNWFLDQPADEQVRIIWGSPAGSAAPEQFTHQVTRILDPELTLPPGHKASDREARAKRSA